METIFDYIDRNGSISLIDKDFNVIDALALSGIAYLPFCDAEDRCNIHFDILKDMLRGFIKNDILIKQCVLPKQDLKFAKKLYKAKRYSGLRVYEYIDMVSQRKEEQFSALTFLLDNGDLFIAFCGTDITLIGWKENLNTSFTLETNGQKSAAEYVERLAYKFPSSKIILGGHSKGGNLAVYAGAFVPENVQDRISEVYNFDGPGFLEDIVEKDGYQRIRPRIKTIIPRSSIVGMILEQSDTYTAIYAKGFGIIEQHNFYNWKIAGDDFLKAKEVSKMSLASHFALRSVLAKMDMDEREQFVSAIHKLAMATKMKTTREVLEHVAGCLKDITSQYINLDKSERKIITRTFMSLGLEFFKATRRKNYDRA